MAKFVNHTSCDACGSSDALAHYSDGGKHCFSCGYTRGSSTSPYVKELEQSDEKVIKIPDDISFEYSQDCLAWVNKYGLTAQDLIKHNVKWSARYQQLIYIYQKMVGGGVGCVQARNFSPNAVSKYFNQGDATNVLPIYSSTNRNSTLVIVEDSISAIKVSGYMDSLPLLGSYLPILKTLAIKKLCYDNVILWLDHDKYKNALVISEQFSYLGVDSRVIVTDLDPKEYTMEYIKEKLK